MQGILKINPDNVDALNYIGYTWTTQGVRLDDAEKILEVKLLPCVRTTLTSVTAGAGTSLFADGFPSLSLSLKRP